MEIDEIISFLNRHAPFETLSADVIASLARKIEIRYFPRGTVIVDAGKENFLLGIVRAGAVELRLGGTELNDRLVKAVSMVIRRCCTTRSPATRSSRLKIA